VLGEFVEACPSSPEMFQGLGPGLHEHERKKQHHGLHGRHHTATASATAATMSDRPTIPL
jgi:hypothetical protein